MLNTLSLVSKVTLLLATAGGVLLHSAYCVESRIMCPGAYVDVLAELAPGIEQATKHTITIVRDGLANIPIRIRAGEIVDVVILPDDALNELIRVGYVAANSRGTLARSSIGMAVRAGSRKPNISSGDALKRRLLGAKSIAYSNQISGVYLSTELFPRLGIADQIKTKTKRIDRERVGAVVARGEAEIGFQQISELLQIRGIDYVGPLPTEVQRVTLFSAGVASGSPNSGPAENVIRFLTTPAAMAIAAKTELEPVHLP